MPRFSEQEKVRIRQLLQAEGEKFFCAYGLKKVSIDELAQAAGIAKATFYRFYESKESLFLDIAQLQQKQIFDALDQLLDQTAAEKDIVRVKRVFETMAVLLNRYPMLQSINKETTELIMRRVSPERLTQFQTQGFDAVCALEAHGIRFKQSTLVVSQLFQTLYQSWIVLQNQPPVLQAQVINIMLDGILEQILPSEEES